MSVSADILIPDEQSLEATFGKYLESIKSAEVTSFVPLLPKILSWQGSPYSLHDHFVFEELFLSRIPYKTVCKTGRQVAKTTNIAAKGVLLAATIPNSSMLYVTPLFEQIRRLSNNYVNRFLRESPIRNRLLGATAQNNVLQRSFSNGSNMYFTFAYLDSERARGLSTDFNNYDEVQDLDPDHLSVIGETLSHSKWAVELFTGTPKTTDNPMERIWNHSSQAEWFIPCQHCTTDGHRTMNIPSLEFHLTDIIGPYREDISEERPATICHKCRQPISPRQGRWVHRYPEKRFNFPGYHIPQIILPVHYNTPRKWSDLLFKQRTYPPFRFFNEVLGESYDESTKLVTPTELKKASTLGPNDVRSAKQRRKQAYVDVTMGVDWGGGGEEGISYTAVAVAGLLPNGHIDIIWGLRSNTPHDHVREAGIIKKAWEIFMPSVMAHDYNGSGALRETFLIHAGIPQNLIMPMVYGPPAKGGPCVYHGPTPEHPRAWYRVDKTRTLQLTCAMIRLGMLRFFNDDVDNPKDPNLVSDFLSLVENKITTASLVEHYRIVRGTTGSDDFAQAVNMACVALWYKRQAYPRFDKFVLPEPTIEDLDKMKAVPDSLEN